eukprot:956333-Prymnesium_polylepis.1
MGTQRERFGWWPHPGTRHTGHNHYHRSTARLTPLRAKRCIRSAEYSPSCLRRFRGEGSPKGVDSHPSRGRRGLPSFVLAGSRVGPRAASGVCANAKF